MTRSACLSAPQLAAAAGGTLPEDTRQHLAGCEVCSKRVALLRRIDAAGVDDITATVEEAETLVARLLIMHRQAWWRTVAHAEYRRPDVAHRLMALADNAGLRDPKLAVALVTAATRIADSLADDTPGVGDLRFDAWKLAAALLREAGKHEAAESALGRAEIAARAASDPAQAEALALFYRALLYAEPDVWRPDEAAALLDRVEPVFSDPHRQQAVRTARAFLLHRAGIFDGARAMFEQILAETPPAPRQSWLDALSNVVSARVESGDATDEVVRLLHSLIGENRALGRPIPVARAEWLMGIVLRNRGAYEESVKFLRGAMDKVDDGDSAIRAGLQCLQTLLAAERHEEALTLARRLAKDAVALDQREPSRRRSLTAEVLAYAREAAQARSPPISG